MTYILRNGRVVDPANGRDAVLDVEVRDGVIARIGANLEAPAGATVLDVPAGCIVTPGLIDMHVHLREPGQEHKETVASGVAAAVAGGFTAVACMPNTSPVNDSAAVTRYIVDKAAAAGLARVYPIGAASVGSKGEQMAEIGELKAAGCVAVSDDGHPIRTALLMRRVLEYAGMLDVLVIDHCEDPTLKGDGVVHEGAVASELGLRGIPGEAEELWIERDITLAGLTKTPVHVAHLSTAGSLRAVRAGKARGIAVTCEVTPHHFVMTDEALRGYDTNTKMNPPLRPQADVDALVEGLADGSVDVIATDHAPHHADEKALSYDQAPFGITGLETAVPLTFDRLVHTGRIDLARMVELLSVNPARILKVPGGSLTEGAPADITVLAPDLAVTIRAASQKSLSKNMPFEGWTLKGGVAATIVGGRLVYRNPAVDGLEGWPTAPVQ
ncbi:dihydroorotase [Luteitalea sp. TBR-22]|uniref:dihydroorotase n=1 Tax=Luteitalea sp. TBR-22 TaxID=2802971 RepID=UPI001AF947D9|nr:dihydroorotase [Luteitalea sp. TBR-22]BCS31525.1 dihydroorotase [Luteitalea sp. TBR-22]